MATFASLGNPYHKPYKSPSEQVLLLQQRGLEISDVALAQACLERIGYYRLSGYWYPFRKSHLSINPVTGAPLLEPSGKEVTIVEEGFRTGANFEQIMDLYVFDKRLRLLFLDAIERIEVALRVDIALLLGKRSPDAHRLAAELDPSFVKNPNGHSKWLMKLDNDFRKSREEFVTHFKRKYVGQLPPIWIAIELWDFGMLSVLLEGLKNGDKVKLAQKYGLRRPALLTSFARNLNHIRNICAHHSRLWNRSPVDRLAPPRMGEVPLLDHLAADINSTFRIYATAAFMQHFLSLINPSTEWAERLRIHMHSIPTSEVTTLDKAGFPEDWDALPLWNSHKKT